jgi:phosphoglycolate phosphatase-like HAD superfamily hydrolase
MTIFDLDGTLIDITDRWYQLHSDVAQEYGLPIIPREEYLAAKRDGVAEVDIMSHVAGNLPEITQYCKARIERIENEEYLNFDKLFDGIKETLTAWQRRGPLVLASIRNNHLAATQELERLGLAGFFQSVKFVRDTGKKALFTEMASEYGTVTSISDSIEDYHEAQEAGLHAIAVGYGCRNKLAFEERGIGEVIASVNDLERLALQ